MPNELGQRAHLAGGLGGGAGVDGELDLLAVASAPGSARAVLALLRPVLVRRRVEEDERENVDVPHPVDAGHEAGGVLEGDVLVPLVLALADLAEDEADRGHGRREERGEHEEAEAPDDALVVELAHARHGADGGLKEK